MDQCGFNVWIGAPEDNRSWDYLFAGTRLLQHERTQQATESAARASHSEELLIAEGSDWNWWYGPEHHSANDRDFDELYRKQLVEHLPGRLGAHRPTVLAQPIKGSLARPSFTPQTAYIHPRIKGDMVRYFDWMGARVAAAPTIAPGNAWQTVSAHDSLYAGIDEQFVYGRLDFKGKIPDATFELVVNVESLAPASHEARQSIRLEAIVEQEGSRAGTVACPTMTACEPP